jgi:hypothetical protein
MIQNNANGLKKRTRRPESILFHSDSSDPDMLYFGSFQASDPYLAFSVGRKKFGVTYFAVNPRRNITAEIVTGRLRETLAAGESAFYQVVVEPEKDRGAIVLHLKARSTSVPGAKDHAKAKIKLQKGRR